MKIAEGLQELPDYKFSLDWGYCTNPQNFFYIVLDVLEQNVEVILVFSRDHIKEFNNMGVWNFIEVLDLTICSLGIYFILEGIEYFFQSTDLICFAIDYFED